MVILAWTQHVCTQVFITCNCCVMLSPNTLETLPQQTYKLDFARVASNAMHTHVPPL